jgi:tetratricopeptide (TPR) repeat protein
MDGRGQGSRFGRAKRIGLGGLLACAALVAKAEGQAPAPQLEDAPAAASYAEAIGEAVGHYSAQRWQQAHDAFARAHALQPSARTLRGLGLANFYLERFADAREAFEQALADTRRPLADDQRRELAELLRSCAAATGRIELRIVPASARVELDGSVTERRVLFLDRGAHALVVSAEGHVPARETLSIAGGEERALELALEAEAGSATTQPTSAPPAHEPARASSIAPASGEASHDSGGRVFTWIAAAAVPVFAGAAAAVWFSGKAERDTIEDECAQQGCDDRELDRRWEAANLDAHATWTNVSLAASAGALVTAAVLFAIEGADAPAPAIALSASHGGAALHGRF